jgi:FkbM family methyltransferase
MPQRTLTGSIAHIVNSGLAGLGVAIKKVPARPLLDQHVKSLLEIFDIDCVVDVGAHHGEFGSILRSLGYSGKIISFEPAEESFRILEGRRSGDTAWEAHRVALGDANETRELMVCAKTECNSFHSPSSYGETSWFGALLQSNGTESVEVKRLDSLLPRLVSDLRGKNVYLKIDTQGHDLQVFEGAEGIFPQVRALQVELPSLQLYEGVPPMEDALMRYRADGFLPTGFFPVSWDGDQVTVVEWDCVLARQTPSGG